MNAQPFWQEEPRKPFKDWRTYMIGMPVLSSGWGACLFMFLAFSFTELSAIPPNVRTWIVVIAAFATAFGSAFGSVGSSVEVYSKAFEGRAVFLDWLSLGLSVLAMMGGFVLGFAALLGTGDQWTAFVTLWGPIALSVLVAGDAASDLIQLGGIFGAYKLRYAKWDQERREWNEATGYTEPVSQSVEVSEPAMTELAAPLGPTASIATTARLLGFNVTDEMEQQLNAIDPAVQVAVDDSSWPVASLRNGDLDRILTRLNGDRATLTAEQLADELTADGLRLPSDSTVKRWLKMARIDEEVN